VTQSGQPVVFGEGGKSAEAASRDVFEEDTLDWILSAKVQDLIQPRIDRIRHGANARTG
jgi:hypothetical protein